MILHANTTKDCLQTTRSWGKWSESLLVVSASLQPHGLHSPWNSLGQNTRVGSLSLLQEIFPTQGSNPGLPPCRRILYRLSHQGNLRMPEWVAFSRGSSQPRNWTGVSYIAGKFFTNKAIREVLDIETHKYIKFKYKSQKLFSKRI